LMAKYCHIKRRRITSEINSTIHSGLGWRSRAHLDHIIPLADCPHDPQDPYAAWRESNLQILCEDCHKAKTAREATERAERRREPTCAS
jgi:5-methylcytosine-specific restriction endonuclease McrA